jgi:hypothetical protein
MLQTDKTKTPPGVPGGVSRERLANLREMPAYIQPSMTMKAASLAAHFRPDSLMRFQRRWSVVLVNTVHTMNRRESFVK